MYTRKYIAFFILVLSSCFRVTAQEKPIGYWTSLLTYNNAIGLATDGKSLFTICREGFFTFTPHGSVESYSKVEGMSDLGMQCISYDPVSNTILLVYANGNIDLFKDNTFYNIPDLKLKTVAGTKEVYEAYIENGFAYLSTSLGIVVIDMQRREVSEVYQFIINNQLQGVNTFVGSDQYFYAASGSSLYKAPKNSPQLQNFQIWQKIDSTHKFTKIVEFGGTLYLSTISDVYAYVNDTLRQVFHSGGFISDINAGNTCLFISDSKNFRSTVREMNASQAIVDSFHAVDSVATVVQLLDSSIWVANVNSGLTRVRDSVNEDYYVPDGPADEGCFGLYANNGEVWIAHGGYNDKYLARNNYNNFSSCKDGKCNQYRQYRTRALDTMNTFVTITKDETDGKVYAGSFTKGLLVFNPSDLSAEVLNSGSILDHSTPNGEGNYEVADVTKDANDNIWVSMFGSYHELYVKEKASGNWYAYTVNVSRAYPYSAGPMTFDDAGHVWYACLDGGGVIAYDTKGTLSDATDDKYYQLRTGSGYGNLPSYTVYSIAHDKSDNIWIGTGDGIGVVYNASACISDRCDAEIPIVQYDQFAGYLFKGEAVRAIAVDGANRKWVGTDNGVWLLSPDAGNSSIIYRFTVDNSPLPSNHIEKIVVDGVTGDVYIGTDKGLVYYRSTAVEGGTENANVLTFPNPVPSGYKGTIAIKGLVANADVRITDINGQLVYRTTALGGQAVWNGLDYKGHRPQSGVYLIFASSSDGAQTYAGKMVFMQ